MQDTFGRTIDYLRIAVTEACNFRCIYCAPNGHRDPAASPLTLDETERVVRAAVALGITKIRLTGGEPLVRRDIVNIMRAVAAIDGVQDLAVTMNGFLLARLAREVPLVRYFKIEVPQAAAKLRALIAAGGNSSAGPFDGEESITLMADLDAGATGTMPSALLPDLIKPVLGHYRGGRRAAAMTAYTKILPLINYENRQCGLRAAKTVMMEGGVIRSDCVRHPLEALHPATRKGLLELARAAGPLALRWGK